ncbi:hypothetical protein HZA97_08075 [Candidatus Woesearchaeota archaeon]|nr:hypothetical protein [Candidatus Woesearchaeota archaeon]
MTKTISDRMTIEINTQDVKENLTAILESMQRIRQESVANLKAIDEQKMDYLRLAGELASCVKAIVEENNLEKHSEEVMNLVKQKPALKNYDLLQEKFWKEESPNFKENLESLTIAILGDDFANRTQSYHVFQALKYLNITDSMNEVLETIQPINTLLNKEIIASTKIIDKIVAKVINKSIDEGTGVRIAEVPVIDAYNLFDEMGVLYIELQKELYDRMQIKPAGQTAVIQEGNKYFVRIIKNIQETQQGRNTFTPLQTFAELHLGKAEECLLRKPSNFYLFGKEFLQEMQDKMRPKENSSGKYEVTIDEMGQDNKNSTDWSKQWQSKGKILASMADIYGYFKEIKRMFEHGSDAEKLAVYKNLFELRNFLNFQGSTTFVTSTNFHHKTNASGTQVVQREDSGIEGLIRKSPEVIIEHFDGTKTLNDLSTHEPLKNQLKAVFDTEDDTETILTNLEFMTGKKRTEIYVRTLERGSRIDGIICDLNFFSDSGKLWILSYDIKNIRKGKSFGVTYKPIVKESKEEKLPALSFQVTSGASKKAQSAYFVNTQEIGEYKKYSGLFCFKDNRYLLSMIIKRLNEDSEETISEVFSAENTSEEKLKLICEQFAPQYAHLAKYTSETKKFTQADDLEYFGK